MTDAATMTPPSMPPDPAWLNLILKLGVLPAIAIYLIWFITSGLGGRFDGLEQTLEAHAVAMQHATEEQKAGDTVDRALLRAICYGVNKADESAKALCEVGR